MGGIDHLPSTPFPAGVCRNGSLEERRWAAVQWSLLWASLFDGKKCAAIFDIDSTLVYTKDGVTFPIPSMQDAFRSLQKMGVALFAVTARSSLGKEQTSSMMREQGLEPRHLFMHPENVPLQSARDAARQKRRAREKIESKGYLVVLSYGDAWSDHDVSSRSELAFKVGDEVAIFMLDDSCAHIKVPTIKE